MAPVMKGAGGTNGGVGMFFAGAAMVIAGGYLLLARVSVVSGGWHFYGYNAFGLSLFPLLIGIGMLFYNGRSVPGWVLTAAGALIIIVGIVANLHIYFQPTSLFDTLMMLGLLAGGIGLVARSLRAIPAVESDSSR
jgi:multisubunit Na+/H+ antiporter MnhF subunit